MNHEIIGKPTDLPWAFIFTRVDDVPRHPTQIYEALSYLATFGVLAFMFFKQNWRTLIGKTFGLFLTLQFLVRFFVEFLKENQSAFEDDLTLNMGQILSIPFIIIGLFFIFKPQTSNK
jgi:prolipoprotein diacylglyceryltransferase